MKIKQAAALTGLTARAIRVYIDEKLIAPEMYESNGRNYVEFSSEDIEQLRLIAALRDAMLSIPQIREMLDEPGKTAEIFESYRSELTKNFGELSELTAKVASIRPEKLSSPEALIAALGDAERMQVARLDRPYEAKPGTCDDGIPRDERLKAYENWQKKQERRDRYAFLYDWIYRVEKRHAIAAVAAVVAVFALIPSVKIGKNEVTPVEISGHGFEIVPAYDFASSRAGVSVRGEIVKNGSSKRFEGVVRIEGFELRDENGNRISDDTEIEFGLMLPGGICTASGESVSFVAERDGGVAGVVAVAITEDAEQIAIQIKGRLSENAPIAEGEAFIVAPTEGSDLAWVGLGRTFGASSDGLARIKSARATNVANVNNELEIKNQTNSLIKLKRTT